MMQIFFYWAKLELVIKDIPAMKIGKKFEKF